MKPNAMRISNKRQVTTGGTQGKTEKNKPSLKTLKKDTTKTEKSKYKPLTGKVFYLDIPSNVISEKLEKDLKELGGRVEGFLSKDISYLISNKKEAKFAQVLGQISPVPSPGSAHTGGNSSPHPSSRRDRHDGNSFKMVDTVRLSRGKSLVEKAIKEQELIPSGTILSNALSWGVKILHVDDIKNYLEQKKKELYLIKKASISVKDVGKRCGGQKSKSRLKNPFVKVEDRSCRYRPFYLQLSSFPVLNYSAPKPYSPFDVDKKNASGQKQTQSKQRNKTNSDQDCGGPVQLPLKDKKKKGYCECCMRKYEDLQTHLESEPHQNFAQSTQYQVVDDIISKFVYDFVDYRDDTQKMKRTKCIMGYFSPVIGNITKTDELKEQLKRQHISFKCYSWKDSKMQELKQDHQHTKVSQSSVQKLNSISEPVCSILPCHPSFPSKVVSKFKSNAENGKIEDSCALNLKETGLSPNFIQLPPQKDNKTYLENLSEFYGHSSNEVFEPEVTLNRKNLQGVQTKLYTHGLVTDSSEKDKNTSQPKRKLNNPFVLPAKYLKKTDANSAFNKKRLDFGVDNDPQREHHIVLKTETLSHCLSTSKATSECAIDSAPSSPSRKLHRKVKLSSGKNKRGNRKQNMELCVKQTDDLSVIEEKKNACCSPMQTLVELFQTSEVNSDFGGFTSYPEKKDSSCLKDIWEGQNANSLWSLFSSSSSTPFIGF
ncbi:protein DBF4 homolog A isoform X1 [Chelonia mydas]|uniref:protein DBF4 homolog A isoform X1 n=1 Tax=Chelonia mydas TaxID=8469 RepID=UPI0018A20BB7|nr:protein DBF4 homolog A isoform X1 [Chelonia mydas]